MVLMGIVKKKKEKPQNKHKSIKVCSKCGEDPDFDLDSGIVTLGCPRCGFKIGKFLAEDLGEDLLTLIDVWNRKNTVCNCLWCRHDI